MKQKLIKNIIKEFVDPIMYFTVTFLPITI